MRVAAGSVEGRGGACSSAEAHDHDDPRRRHGEPAEHVWYHASDVVERALRTHEEVAPLLGDGLVRVLNVVQRPVLAPLVLRDQLERARVAVVVRAAVVVLAVAKLFELIRADRVVVVLLVDERLWRADVLDEESERLVGCGGCDALVGYVDGSGSRARAHHGTPVEQKDRRERVLLADAEGDGDRHGHEGGGDRILIGKRGTGATVRDSMEGWSVRWRTSSQRQGQKQSSIWRQYQNQLRAEGKRARDRCGRERGLCVRTRDSLTNARMRRRCTPTGGTAPRSRTTRRLDSQS